MNTVINKIDTDQIPVINVIFTITSRFSFKVFLKSVRHLPRSASVTTGYI
ncbi:hypothetical protein Hanom_Chr14g01275351 [Helianthus anomalus]